MLEGFSQWRLMSPEEKFGFVCGWIVGIGVFGGLFLRFKSWLNGPTTSPVGDNSSQLVAWLVALGFFALLAYGAARLTNLVFTGSLHLWLRSRTWPRRWRRWTPDERAEWWRTTGRHRMEWSVNLDERKAKVDYESPVFPRRSPEAQRAVEQQPPKDYSTHVHWIKVSVGIFVALVLLAWVTGWSSPKYVVAPCSYFAGDGVISCFDFGWDPIATDEPTPLWASLPACTASGITSVPIATLEAQARSSANGMADAACALIDRPSNLGVMIFGWYIGF